MDLSISPCGHFAGSTEFSFWAGSETDVLDRYLGTARRYRGDPILRITADCPLVIRARWRDLIANVPHGPI